MSSLIDDAMLFGHLAPKAVDEWTPRLLMWSGRDVEDERRVRSQLLGEVDRRTPRRVSVWGDNTAAEVRAAVVTTAARTAQDVAAAPTRPRRAGGPRPVALLFPGQGSQHAGMAADLHRHEPVFRDAVEETLLLWGEEGTAIRADWLGPNVVVPVDDVCRAQPLLFAVDHALGRLLLSWGIEPAAVLGHSAGEVVAATLAGVFTVAEAVELVRDRVAAAAPIPPGGMLAVAASEAELRLYLVGDVAIAAVNATRQTMLAGPCAQLDDVATRLAGDGFTLRTVPATTPFHCPAMAPAVVENERSFAAVPRPPRWDLYSGYTGALMTAADARSPAFWASQLADTVYFDAALGALLDGRDWLLIEAGPGQTLSAFARRQRAVRSGASSVVPMLPGGPGAADRRSVLDTAAQVWLGGHDLDLAAF